MDKRARLVVFGLAVLLAIPTVAAQGELRIQSLKPDPPGQSLSPGGEVTWTLVAVRSCIVGDVALAPVQATATIEPSAELAAPALVPVEWDALACPVKGSQTASWTFAVMAKEEATSGAKEFRAVVAAGSLQDDLKAQVFVDRQQTRTEDVEADAPQQEAPGLWWLVPIALVGVALVRRRMG